jgi:stage II sporulation protein D
LHYFNSYCSSKITNKNNSKKFFRFFPYVDRIFFSFFLLLSFVVFIGACSSSKRFTSNERLNENKEFKSDLNSIRILLDEKPTAIYITIQNKVYLFNEKRKIAEVNNGNTIECYGNPETVSIKIGRQNFIGRYFQIVAANGNAVKYNGHSYKGSLRIVSTRKSVLLLNFVDLENYLKGVISKEMPLGDGNENFEALKAFAISARTYTVTKMYEGNLLYDIFPDTRDQVYGGESSEETISNKAVEETAGMILTFNGEPAKVYYHSTCGGETEDVENVFPKPPVPYLVSVKDGSVPYCKISPRYEWEEVYSDDDIIRDLFESNLISNTDYKLDDFRVVEKFNSGRVKDLKFDLSLGNETKEIHLYGNEIRSKLRTPEKNRMLWSTLFEIKESGNKIIIDGKGYGHGVGFCQWGAIGRSREGQNYTEILNHYFPGTTLGKVND